MDEGAAVEALKEVKNILDKSDIEYWLDMGTPLGAVRDGKIIPWDSDIDLGVWNREIDKFSVAIPKFIDKDFKVFCRSDSISIVKYKNDERYLISISLYNLNKNDNAEKVWIVHPKEINYDGIKIVKHKTLLRLRMILNYSLWLLSAPTFYGDSPNFVSNDLQVFLVKLFHMFPNCLRKSISNILLKTFKLIGFQYFNLKIPSYYFKNFTEIDFYGMTLKTPHSREEYLEYRYGKNWKIPKQDYIYYKEDGSIIKN